MKKIFSFVVVMAAVAMVSCSGNSNKKAAQGEAAAVATRSAMPRHVTRPNPAVPRSAIRPSRAAPRKPKERAATNNFVGHESEGDSCGNPLFLCPVFPSRPEPCERTAVPCNRF